jgi:hypothetical protein
MWLVTHTLEQFSERMYRWPASAEHFTEEFIVWCKNNLHNTIITQESLTPFVVAINSDCECRKLPDFNDLSVVNQYRAYIKHDKPFVSWTKREKPTWF